MPETPPALSLSARLALALTVLIAIGLFGFTYGFDLVLTSAEFWTDPKNDMAAMLAGHEALLSEPWGFPLTVTDRLDEHPLATVFTDSLPWMSLTLKALGLGGVLNPLGVFLLVTYILQPIAMAAVLRACGARKTVTYLAGCLLALMLPAWLARQFGHIALTGHALILFGLALSIATARFGLTWRRTLLFAGLALMAVGVHVYHLVPIGAAFAAALVSTLSQRGLRALGPVLLAGAGVSAVVLVAALALGYSVGHGESGGAAAFGVYSMNILGPIYPQASALAGQKWTGGWYTGVLDPNGGQSFEGFSYLGGGVLLAALAATVVSLLALRRSRPTGEQLRRFWPLAAATVVLFIIAVGPNAYFGDTLVYEAPRPSGTVAAWLGFFRGHGRFFWMGSYLIAALSLVAIEKFATARAAIALGVLAVALQAFDTGPLRTGVRATYDHPSPSYWPAALMTAPDVRGRPWVFVPGYHCADDVYDRITIAQLALVAIRTEGRANTVGAARALGDDCAIPPGARATAAPQDPRITVITNGGRSVGGRFSDYAGRTDCHHFLRGLICGANLSDVAGLSPATGDEMRGAALVGAVQMRFDKKPKPPMLSQGWSAPDDKGVWSDGPFATIDLAGTVVPGGPRVIEIDTHAYGEPPLSSQRIAVSANGVRLPPIDMEVGVYRPYRLTIPVDAVRPDGSVQLRFDFPDPRSVPGESGKRSIAIRGLTVAPKTSAVGP